MSDIITIKDGEDIAAIIIKSTFQEPGAHFPTPEYFNLQVGIHNRPAGTAIKPHVHKTIKELRDVPVQEFFILEKGRVRVDLFSREEKFIAACELEAGDSAIIISGHGMEFLEESRIVEVKQGPYRGVEADKKMIE